MDTTSAESYDPSPTRGSNYGQHSEILGSGMAEQKNIQQGEQAEDNPMGPSGSSGQSLDGSSKRKHDQVSTGDDGLPDKSSPMLGKPGSLLSPNGPDHLAGEPDFKRVRSNHSPVREIDKEPSTSNLSEQLYGLTPALWQKVFCFVPPIFLGRLLRVSRSFHKLLTLPNISTSLSREGFLHASNVQDAEAVWIASRKRFAPGLPKSLHGKSELDMWRLLRGSNCQVCDTKKTLSVNMTSPDHGRAGPGQNTVRVVWPFGTRFCGPCLRNETEKVSPGR